MSRWDSAAIVEKTSELLPDPETPVNTVNRRFGMSRLTSRRLFSRAPRTSMAPQSFATGRSADGLLDELDEPPLGGRRELQDREGDREELAVVDLRVGLEPERRVADLELRLGLEEAD